MHTMGVLDPDDPRTPRAVAQIHGLIGSMPWYRIFAPDIHVLGRAALLAGIVCRLQGNAADRKLRALQDCMLLLQAQSSASRF
ncbi:MAG TPA: hypothetical protein VFY92_00825 [Hyphomicrobiaceae bacterium]|nr:hypothetical protein [Hyphomicrobiaceae bacterium]